MSCISFVSTIKTIAVASLTEETPPPSPRIPTSKLAKRPKLRTTNKPQPPHLQSQPYNSQNSSIIQIERAIGAGSYRDTDSEDLRKRNTVFDGILPTGGHKFEGEIEKKIRETGEWLSSQTEARFRSSGKQILIVVFQWILPIWTLSLLVAAGVIKLPFSMQLLEDLLM